MKRNSPSVKGLVLDCQNGLASSKEKLYKTFYGYVMAVIIRYVNTADDAQELVNDAFMKIFNHIDGFKGPEEEEGFAKSFKGWIAKVASRTAIDHLRKQKINFETSEIEQARSFVSIDPLTSNMEVAGIMSLLNQLPHSHKLVFNLYEVEGYSHDEISKMLNIPASSSRVFLTRAKTKLRALYASKFSTC